MPKALSLLQPWASLVVTGAKKIETRSWNTAYRGPLLIHASKGKGGAAIAAEPLFRKFIPHFGSLPFGAIIGKVLLRDVVRIPELGLPPELIERLTLEERAFGAYAAGRYAWILEEPLLYDEPVPAKGSLGLWDAG
jgi:hypothetical protein